MAVTTPQDLDGRPRLLVVDRGRFAERYNEERDPETAIIEHLPHNGGWSGIVRDLLDRARAYETLSRDVNIVVEETRARDLRLGVRVSDSATIFTDAIPPRLLVPRGAVTTGGLQAVDAVARVCDALHPVLEMVDRLKAEAPAATEAP